MLLNGNEDLNRVFILLIEFDVVLIIDVDTVEFVLDVLSHIVPVDKPTL